MSKRELWMGVVHLKPIVARDWSAFDGGRNWDEAGAYCNIVTWASNAEEFRANADVVAGDCKLYVVEVQNVGPLSQRDPSELSAELDEIRVRAEANPNAIIFGTFHTYTHEDA